LNRTLLFAALALLTSFTVARAEPRPGNDSARAALGEFAFDVYRQLAAEAPGRNVFCSPYSLYGALAMCAEGARGETAVEMGQALRFPKDLRRQGDVPWHTTPIHAGLAALNRRFAAPSSDHELGVANALWVDRSCLLRRDYLATITTHYRAGIYGVDFQSDRRGTIRKINAWAAKQTHGRIRDLLSESSPLSRLVITNAIYFKGDWAEPFEKRQSEDEPFILADGSQARTRTMIQSSMESVRYGAFEGDGTFFQTPRYIERGVGQQKLYPDERGFTVLEMPYKGGDLSMVLIVPRSATGLGAVEKALGPANVGKWLDVLEKRSVHVHVPRFRMETEYDMRSALEALGMRRAFVPPGPGGAQFEGMTVDDAPDRKLYVGRVVHKAFVEVNEKGTEAAAVTAVEALCAAAPPIGPVAEPFTPTFRADRPFVFLVRDTKSGTVLFVGRVNDPRR
jgi:serine protease inhibitor